MCGSGSTTQNAGIEDCPVDHYCPPGTKTSLIANHACPAGYYAPWTNSMSLEDCIICPPGKYCLAGAGEATCDQGYYCPEGTQTATQFPCSPGYYNDATGAHSVMACKHCGINNECPDFAMTSPTQCTNGFYNDASTSATNCATCPAGFYCE